MSLWFTEVDGSGLRISYKIKEVLFQGQSRFQKIDVIDTDDFGRMLLLDELVMCTEKDEFVYHEMISHVPLFVHGKVNSALVIGGGDGGTVRELLRHDAIENVTLCEIDEMVVDTARKFFPSLAAGLTDERVSIKYESGLELIKGLESQSFDLVIVDSTDPVGPGAELFSASFYKEVKRVIGENGIMVCQSESPWYDQSTLRMIYENLSSSFRVIHPYLAAVPTYPSGYWSFSLASDNRISPEMAQMDSCHFMSDLKYLNQKVLKAAFALPQFYLKKLGLG